MSIERRYATRHRAYLPLRLRAAGATAAVETLTKDLSIGGLRCVSPEPLPVASDARLELIIAAAQEPLTLQAKVRWFRTLPYADQCELGLEFQDLSPKSARRLSTYLSRLIEQTPN